MSITDELRKWARQFRRVWVDPHSGDLTYITNEHACPPSLDAMRLEDYITAIANRIDAEHESAMEEARAEGMQEGFVADKGPREFIELPKDADGEPWRLGDELMMEGEVCEVVGIGGKTIFYAFGDGIEWTIAHNNKHHHAPTVEDVLREFVTEFNRDDTELCDEEIIERFAAKLRLAKGDSE